MNKINPKIKKIWKELLAPMLLFIAIVSVLLTVTVPANAQSANDIINQVGKQTGLTNYDDQGHELASVEPGARNITTAIFYAIDFVKYVTGTIAVVLLIISGIKLVFSGKKVEEAAEKEKEHFKYALIGLVVIVVADQFIKKVFFGEQGEVFSSKTALQEAATAGSDQIKGIYSVMAYVSGSIAILMIVVAGIRYMASAGNEEEQGKLKQQITYALIGLMLIGVAEFVVKDVVFPKQGTALSDMNKAKQLIVNLTNFLSGFLSTISVVMYIYGGYLYVTTLGNEEATGKAKKVFIGATIGLLLALAAFGIVSTTIKLEPTAPGAGAPQPAITGGNL